MIIKVRNKPGFAQIQNSTLRDKRLSLDTRGALGEILTYSEDFEADVGSLKALWGIGREKLLKITNELKENGYLEIIPIRDKRGQVIDKEWSFYGESQNVNFRRKVAEPEIDNRNLITNQDAEKPNDGESVQDAAFPNVRQNQTTEKPHDIYKDGFKEKYEEEDLKTQTQKNCADVRPFSNGLPKKTDAHPVRAKPDDTYAKTVWDYLAEKRMDTPFENPKWENAINYAWQRGFTAPEFVGTINFLLTDPEQKKWRKGRITAEIVTNNLQVYFDLQKETAVSNSPPDFSACADCDSRGLREIKIDGIPRMTKCRHEKLKRSLEAVG